MSARGAYSVLVQVDICAGTIQLVVGGLEVDATDAEIHEALVQRFPGMGESSAVGIVDTGEAMGDLLVDLDRDTWKIERARGMRMPAS